MELPAKTIHSGTTSQCRQECPERLGAPRFFSFS
jgi:hypothetical protein